MTSVNPVEDIYELSPMQHGLLFDNLGSGDAGMHTVQLVYDLGALDVAAFQSAWQAVVDRHAMLRTSFRWEDLGTPHQIVWRRVDVPLRMHDWSARSPEERRASLEPMLAGERRRGFALDVAPVFRLSLVRLAPAQHVFAWTFHHILFEGWSASLVLRDLIAVYGSLVNGERIALPEPPRYRDYIRWIQEQPAEAAEPFWRRELAGFRAATALPGLDSAGVSVHHASDYDVRLRRLSRRETERLTSFARSLGVTVNTLVQGAWAILLSRTSGDRDVVFGTLVSGRSAPVAEVDRMVGLFTNILPSRVAVEPRSTVSAWLRDLQGKQARLREHEHLALVQVKAWSEVPAGRPLFETLVVFENWLGDVTLEDSSGPLDVRGVRGHQHGGPGFPLSLVVWPGEELSLSVNYDRGLVTDVSAERFLDLLHTILRGLVSLPDARLEEIPLLTAEQELAIVRDGNAAGPDLPRETCIHHLFEAQVKRSPDAVAVALDERSLTYAELNARANRLAHALQALGVGPESRVGICLERSLEMVVAIWGVLKAGGAYVPLDPTLPAQRVAFVLRDSAVSVVLTQQALVPRMPAGLENVLCLDADHGAGNGEVPANPRSLVSPDNLAFVTYTSGSTGRPKGAMTVHRGLVNAFLGWERAYGLGDVQSHLVVASFAVDVFTADVVRGLCSGGRVVLAPQEVVLSPPRLCDLLIDEKIEYVELVPHVASLVVAHLESTGRILADLRLLVVGSDVWLGSEWARARSVCGPDVRMINAYGLNETSVDCTIYEDGDGGVAPGAYVPIGRPLPNHRVYVLDERGRPVPRGVPGELWIGGEGLARGYWNRPATTAERCLPDPFAEIPGARMFRTGDRVRTRPDGNIELLGRVDDQLKIRAFRVEPGEIEHTLREHPAVDQAVTVVREDDAGNAHLVAYLACGDERPSAQEVRRHLADRLPSHMVPGFFVFLDEMPLTGNRLKVDRAALPPPDWTPANAGAGFVAPRTEMERWLADVWVDVLPADRVGALDNFMDLGGHSLLLIPVLARAERELGLRLAPGEMIFQTLRQVAATLERRRGAAREEPRKGLLRGLFRRG